MEYQQAPAKRETGPETPAVLSYLQLRKTVGIIGFALPFVLALVKIFVQGPGIEPSISAYYYTRLGDVFVGSLCTIGVFLFSTKGYDARDKIAGFFSGVFAVGTALVPTTPEVGATSLDKLIGRVHFSFAALLFMTLAVMCLVLFTRSSAPTPSGQTGQKRKRNALYRFCGVTILVCVALIAIDLLTPLMSSLQWLRPEFWLETAAVLAFGAAWLVKGETFLKDNVI